jgi:hypothetical protein
MLCLLNDVSGKLQASSCKPQAASLKPGNSKFKWSLILLKQRIQSPERTINDGRKIKLTACSLQLVAYL